ncbi:MAG: hypothetical protein ACTHXP_05530 [Agrococcus casei]|uniref:hypothetical protein n=1 Tax=Agrococcus casei TaxID=343512 RepID=UPI003F903A87
MTPTRRRRLTAAAFIALLPLATSACFFDSSLSGDVDAAVEQLDPTLLEVTESVGGVSQGKSIQADVLDGATPEAVAADIWQPIEDHEVMMQLRLPSGATAIVGDGTEGEDAVAAVLAIAFDERLAEAKLAQIEINEHGVAFDITSDAPVAETYSLADQLVTEHGVDNAYAHLTSTAGPEHTLIVPMTGSGPVSDFVDIAVGDAATGITDLSTLEAHLEADEAAAVVTVWVSAESPSTAAQAQRLFDLLDAAFDAELTLWVNSAAEPLVDLP